MNNGIHLAMAALSGVAFAVMGVAYRHGQARGIHTMHIVAICSPVGALCFGWRAWGDGLSGLPWMVSLAGMAAGVSQFLLLYVIRAALRRGPLASLWCALMLGFVPGIVYSAVVFGEPLGWSEWGAILLAVGAVAAAASNLPDSAEARTSRRPLGYGLLLVLALLLNAVPLLALTDLGHRGIKAQGLGDAGAATSLLARFGNVYFFLLYACMTCGIAADQGIVRRPLPALRAWLPLGLLAAAGSVTGMWLIGRCAFLPAAQVFTLSSVASILAGALFGTALFGEKRNVRWYACIALCCAAVLVAR